MSVVLIERAHKEGAPSAQERIDERLEGLPELDVQVLADDKSHAQALVTHTEPMEPWRE